MNVESRNYGLKIIPMAKEKMTHVPAEQQKWKKNKDL